MPRYPKTPKNVPFDGVKGIHYDSGYVFNKIVFMVDGNTLNITWFMGNKRVEEIQIREFKTWRALAIIKSRMAPEVLP